MIVIPERETPGASASCLGEPDRDRLAEAEVADLPLLRHAVGEPEQHAEDGEEDCDLPGLAEVLLDDALAQRSGERGRDRRGEDAPRGPLLRAPDPSVADAAKPGGDERGDVVPEVGDDGDQRPQMKRHVERLVEVGVLLEIGPVAEPRDENQMARGRDRQELGEPLHDSEGERLPVGEDALDLADPQDSEHGGGDEGRRSRQAKTSAAHPGIVCALREPQRRHHRDRRARPRRLRAGGLARAPAAEPGLPRPARRRAPPRRRASDHRDADRGRGLRREPSRRGGGGERRHETQPAPAESTPTETAPTETSGGAGR